MKLLYRFCAWTLLTCSILASIAASAAENLQPLVIGRNADFSGPNSARVLESQAGADAYIQWVNSRGGINGRKLVLKTLDDANDPKKPVVNARELVEREGALVLFMPNSTPSILSVLKDYAEPANIPILAPLAGPDSFHTPARNVLFNLRAKYQAEIAEAVRYFSTVGQKRLAIIHTDDAFGKDGLVGYQSAVKAHGAQSVFEGSFDREKLDVRKHLPRLSELRPDAIVAVGSAKAVIELIGASRSQGIDSTFMTMSNNSSESFVKALGPNAPGVIISQVMPPPASAVSRLGLEFRDVAMAKGVPNSYAAMEGFVAAKLLVEGLKRAGKTPTRESFIRAMEAMRGVDLGGIEVTYGPQDRTGSTRVELSIVAKDGRFRM